LKTNISIYQDGTEVTTKIGKIKAIITAANIRGSKIAYEISYFNNGEYKTAWLCEKEFTTDKKVKKITVGFKSN